MSWSQFDIARLATLILLSTLAKAAPKLSFALNAQVPPVAYAQQPYEFIFAPDTFERQDVELTYQLSNNPDWLSIDGSRRRLFGTPTDTDIGSLEFVLLATDNTGTSECEVALIVLEQRELSQGGSIAPELAVTGKVSSPSTLLLRPGQDFSFTVSKDLFKGVSASTSFYAVCQDNSPLPSWIQFNSQAVRFFGTSPPLMAGVADDQLYSFKLAASNIVGFSEATLSFQINIENHILAFEPPMQAYTTERGSSIKIPSLLQHLKLDEHLAERQDLSQVISNIPVWLTLNDSDLSLNGTVPTDADDRTYMITVASYSGGIANMSIELQIANSSDKDQGQVYLGHYDAFTGSYFSHSIEQQGNANDSSVIGKDLGGLSSWLKFEPSALLLHGSVPCQQNLGQYNVSVALSNKTITRNVVLTVDIVTSPNMTANCHASSTSTAIDNSTSSTSLGNDAEDWSQQAKIALALKICLPLLFVGTLTALIICFRMWNQRRKATAKQRDEEKQDHPQRSGPGTNDTSEGPAVGNREVAPAEGTASVESNYATKPPGLLNSIEMSSADQAQKNQVRHIASSWDDLITPYALDLGTIGTTKLFKANSKSSRKEYPLMKHSGSSDVRESSISRTNYYKPHRTSTTKLSDPIIHKPLGVARRWNRVSGAGHGSGITTNLYDQMTRSSWYTTFNSTPLSGSRSSTVTLNFFPVPPSQSRLTRHTLRRSTSKVVPALTTDAENKTELFEEARQRYYSNRAKDRSRIRARFSSNAIAKSRQGSILQSHRPNNPSEARSDSPGVMAHYRPSHRYPTAPLQTVLARDISKVSSRQFDSPISSESLWEDEDLSADENSPDELDRALKGKERVPLSPLVGGASEMDTGKGRGRDIRGGRHLEYQRSLASDDGAKVKAISGGQRPGSAQHDSFRFI